MLRPLDRNSLAVGFLCADGGCLGALCLQCRRSVQGAHLCAAVTILGAALHHGVEGFYLSRTCGLQLHRLTLLAKPVTGPLIADSQAKIT